MARCQDRLAAHVLFFKPRGFPDGWEKSDLWLNAAAIPGVAVIEDDGGEIALFSAATSGETILYDSHGRLLFHGGITASRGHEGDNQGRDAIVSLLTNKALAQAGSLVFGCPLRDTDSRSAEGVDQCNK